MQKICQEVTPAEAPADDDALASLKAALAIFRRFQSEQRAINDRPVPPASEGETK